jgi:hypothetical protein
MWFSYNIFKQTQAADDDDNDNDNNNNNNNTPDMAYAY